MINKIIDGICIAIHSEFGDDYEIYTETVEQGLKEPCFSIACVNPASEQFFGKRYFRTNQFCIHYFPSSSDKKTECYSVLEKLMNSLELITVNNEVIRGTEMHGEFVEDVLHFFVNYDMFVYKEQEKEPAMEDVEYKSDVKGD